MVRVRNNDSQESSFVIGAMILSLHRFFVTSFVPLSARSHGSARSPMRTVKRADVPRRCTAALTLGVSKSFQPAPNASCTAGHPDVQLHSPHGLNGLQWCAAFVVVDHCVMRGGGFAGMALGMPAEGRPRRKLAANFP